MNIPLRELKEKAVIEITNKIVNNMSMSEVMDIIIKYSEQTAKGAVKDLDRASLKKITEGQVSIDKDIKREVPKKHSGWKGRGSKPQKKPEAVTGKTRKTPPEKQPEKSWLSLFGGDKKRHSGWNRKTKKSEGLLSKIKNFFKSK